MYFMTFNDQNGKPYIERTLNSNRLRIVGPQVEKIIDRTVIVGFKKSSEFYRVTRTSSIKRFLIPQFSIFENINSSDQNYIFSSR